MHVVSFTEPVTVAGVRLKAGVGYVMNNTGAGSVLMDRRLVDCADGERRPVYRLASARAINSRPLVSTWDYNGRSIYLFRGGGFGDLMMATPTVREIKRRWPRARVVFVTLPEYAVVLEGLDCEVRTGFVEEEELAQATASIFFEGVIEDNAVAREVHAVEMFARWAGLDALAVRLPAAMGKTNSVESARQLREGAVTIQDSRLHRFVSEDLLRWAREKFPKRGGKRPRIGIQAAASSAVRTYPAKLLVKLIALLQEELHAEICLFGKPGAVACELPLVLNLSDLSAPMMGQLGLTSQWRHGGANGLTFAQSAAMLSNCDLVIVPDSALLHVAGTLDVPAIALFGSFDGRLRVDPVAPVRVLQAGADCAPCFWHESGRQEFPPDGPCQVAKCCSVLASISPERIVGMARLWLGEIRENAGFEQSTGGWEASGQITPALRSSPEGETSGSERVNAPRESANAASEQKVTKEAKDTEGL